MQSTPGSSEHEGRYDDYEYPPDESSMSSAILMLVALVVLLLTFIVVLSLINPWMADFLSSSDVASPTTGP